MCSAIASAASFSEPGAAEFPRTLALPAPAALTESSPMRRPARPLPLGGARARRRLVIARRRVLATAESSPAGPPPPRHCRALVPSTPTVAGLRWVRSGDAPRLPGPRCAEPAPAFRSRAVEGPEQGKRFRRRQSPLTQPFQHFIGIARTCRCALPPEAHPVFSDTVDPAVLPPCGARTGTYLLYAADRRSVLGDGKIEPGRRARRISSIRRKLEASVHDRGTRGRRRRP